MRKYQKEHKITLLDCLSLTMKTMDLRNKFCRSCKARKICKRILDNEIWSVK